MATPSAGGEAIINVDEPLTWKSVFDAGFRPSLVGDGLDKCRQLNVHVKLKTATGAEVLDLGIGDVEFSLRDGHLLHLLAFYGREYRSVIEVEEKSRAFARMFGDNVTRKAEIGWFEVTNTVDYGGRAIDPPEVDRVVDHKNAINHAKRGDLSFFYNFRTANNRDRPMVERFSISLKSTEAMTVGRLKSRIEPPAGYEHLSLEAGSAEAVPSPPVEPKEHATRTSQSPSTVPDQPASVSEQTSVTAATDGASRDFSWPWIIGLIIVAVGVFVKVKRK